MPDPTPIHAHVHPQPRAERPTLYARFYRPWTIEDARKDSAEVSSARPKAEHIHPMFEGELITIPGDAMLRAAAERAKERESCAAELKEMLDGEHFIPDHHIQRVEDAIKLLRGEQ